MTGQPESAGHSHEQVLADYKRRLQDLLDTFWSGALAGEHKSAELCCRVLQQYALLHGVDGKSPPPAVSKGDDELAKLRARRTSA